MSRRVFISRDLRSDSPFRRLLRKQAYEVSGRSLIEFSAIKFTSPPTTDWVFCYSSRSAEFFLKRLAELGISPQDYPNYAALGKGTAQRLVELGIEPAFTGTGAPEDTAAAFGVRAAGQSVLFPRAEQSRQSIQRLLEGKLEMLDLIVYRNRQIRDLQLPDTDFVVLTSPLNARAYAACKGYSKAQRIVAIGHTTARALDALGVKDYRIADQASEEALAASVLNWEIQQ